MQKIFDVNNKEDMDLLWSILSERIVKLKRKDDIFTDLIGKKVDWANFDCMNCSAFNIHWHDKTEITRPVNYEDMIGCVGWVGNSRDARDRIGILNSYYKGSGYPFETTDGDEFAFFTPAKKSELKFYGD